MVKVCHMSSVHSNTSTRILLKECASLAKQGYDTYYVAEGESREESGVHVIGFGKRSGSRLGRMVCDAKKVYRKALSLQADVYHFHDPELLPYGAKLVRKGYKVIWDSHENYMDFIENKYYLPVPVRKVLGPLFRSYYKHVLPKFSAVVIASHGSRDLLEQYCKKLCVITNYPIIDPQEELLPPDYTSKKLVFAGSISSQWAHQETIEALQDCPGVCYVLCGKKEGAFFETLKALPGWEQVEFRGYIPFTEVGNVMAECAVGLTILKPSYNTHGRLGTIGVTKLFEEMYAGLPVICSDFTLWREIIEKYQCGLLVDPEDPAAIRDAIMKLTGDPALSASMGAAGRKAVQEEYNWATEEKKLLALYDQILQDDAL